MTVIADRSLPQQEQKFANRKTVNVPVKTNSLVAMKCVQKTLFGLWRGTHTVSWNNIEKAYRMLHNLQWKYFPSAPFV